MTNTLKRFIVIPVLVLLIVTILLPVGTVQGQTPTPTGIPADWNFIRLDGINGNAADSTSCTYVRIDQWTIDATCTSIGGYYGRFNAAVNVTTTKGLDNFEITLTGSIPGDYQGDWWYPKTTQGIQKWYNSTKLSMYRIKYNWNYTYSIPPNAGSYVLEYNPWESRALTFAFRIEISRVSNSTRPLPTPTIGNLINDGDMEQQPSSSWWMPMRTYTGDTERLEFGRLNTASVVSFGAARCSTGMQAVGLIPDWANELPYWQRPRAYADINQRFTWSGGRIYYRYSVKGKYYGNWDSHWVPYKISFLNNSTGQEIVIADEYIPQNAWRDKENSIEVSAGSYTIVLGMGTGAREADVIFFDDVYLADAPLPPPCIETLPAQTATAAWVLGTPTITTTPGTSASNILNNCGFSQGQLFWDFPPNTELIYEGTNNYAHLRSSASSPGVTQTFSWSGGYIFVAFDAQSAYNVWITNTQTGQVYRIADGVVNSGWVNQRGSTFMPSGSYRINLYFPVGAGPADYDNVTASSGGYVTCSAGSAGGPTALPSRTPNYTPTFPPTNTIAPTRTVMPNTSTPTRQPTLTPWLTYTPVTPRPPTYTPRPPATSTPYPTYTAQATYTPFRTPTMSDEEKTANAPTYTPPPQTPTPPVPPPPPGYSADCNRPQNGADIAGWLEYEKCQTLSYFDFSPRAAATYAAIPTMFAGHEPFGSISEVSETNKQLQDLINSYDWDSTGLDGMDAAPNPGMFTEIENGPWNGDPIDLQPGTADYSTSCGASLTKVVGKLLAGPMCFIFNILRELALLPWFQLFVNISCIGGLLFYIWHQWIRLS